MPGGRREALERGGNCWRISSSLEREGGVGAEEFVALLGGAFGGGEERVFLDAGEGVELVRLAGVSEASFETVALAEGDGLGANAVVDFGPAGGELGGGEVGLKVCGANFGIGSILLQWEDFYWR